MSDEIRRPHPGSSRGIRRTILTRGRASGQAVTEFALIIPIALLLVLAVGDMARVYTTTLSVESAAREAADYGAFQSSNWLPVNQGGTWVEMQRRACTAASTLPDYQSADPNNTCTNPSIAFQLQNPDSIDCTEPVPVGSRPCVVHVTAQYDFRLFFGGVGIPGLFQFPETIPITRDVFYVVNDFPTT